MRDPANSNLIIRPADQLRRGRSATSSRCATSNAQATRSSRAAFRVYRDRLITQQAPVEGRRPHIENLIATLQQNGFQRFQPLHGLGLHRRQRGQPHRPRRGHARRRAVRHIGDAAPGDPMTATRTARHARRRRHRRRTAPSFTITGTEQRPRGPGGDVLRQVDGELHQRALLLDQAQCPPFLSSASRPVKTTRALEPSTFARDPEESFESRSAASSPSRWMTMATLSSRLKPGTYGHGLLGEHAGGRSVAARLPAELGLVRDQLGRLLEDQRPLVGSPRSSDLSQLPPHGGPHVAGFVDFHYLGRR